MAAVSLSFAMCTVARFHPGYSSLPLAELKGVVAPCILLLMLVSSRLAATLINVCTVAKAFSLLVIAGGDMVVLGRGRGHTEALLSAFHNNTKQAGRVGMASHWGLRSFDGWSSLSCDGEAQESTSKPMSLLVVGEGKN